MSENKQYTKYYERAQQTINLFDKFHRRSLQAKVLDEKEFESLCKFFTKHVNEFKKLSLKSK